MTMLRHPVDIALSMINKHNLDASICDKRMGHRQLDYMSGCSNFRTPPEDSENSDTCKESLVSSIQGFSTSGLLENCDRSDHDHSFIAAKHLKEFDFVGITERYEESQFAFREKFRVPIPDDAIPAVSKNVHHHHPSKEDVEKCTSLMGPDISLYNLGVDLFNVASQFLVSRN
jgi:hypothetical protein